MIALDTTFDTARSEPRRSIIIPFPIPLPVCHLCVGVYPPLTGGD